MSKPPDASNHGVLLNIKTACKCNIIINHKVLLNNYKYENSTKVILFQSAWLTIFCVTFCE